MSRAYLCVSVDTECDKGEGWRTQRPLAFAGVRQGIGERLQPLFARFGAKPTYLVSPEVLRDEASVEVLRRCEPSCELGVHLHGEFVEPHAFEPDVTRAFQRHYPPAVERAKATAATDLFIRAFGQQPRSFRAGRFGIGPASIPILEDLGYAVDSSVTPHLEWSSAGAPDLSFHGAPTQPYHPDPSSPARPGRARLLEVPVTIRQRAANAVPGLGALVEPRWLRPTRTSGAALVRLAEDEIADARRTAPGRPVILNAMFHNVEVVADASPYAATDARARAILDRVQALLQFARREAIAVIGLADVPEVLAA